MAKAGGARVNIVLESTESPYRYHTTKNKRTHPARLVLRKYDPILRRHVDFKETK